MYAIRPWGKACIVGCTIGSLVCGIGMRLRETLADIIEKRNNPLDEIAMTERCVISQHTLRLLVDLGVTETNLLRVLRPAKRWKLVTHSLDALREGDTYPNCSPAEPVYHITKGELLRCLRREYLRDGGQISWETVAYEAFTRFDTTENTLCLKKDWGTAEGLDCIVCATPNHQIRSLLVEEPQASLKFDVDSGCCPQPPQGLFSVFNSEYDCVVAVGAGVAVHMWVCSPTSISWRAVSAAGTMSTAMANAHPLVKLLVSKTPIVRHDVKSVALDPPVTRPDAENYRLVAIDKALVTVDPFEFRGDAAQCAIEDSVELCRRLYQRTYRRNFAPLEFRSFELDTISKRMPIVARDIEDVQGFLRDQPVLPRERKADYDEPPKISS